MGNIADQGTSARGLVARRCLPVIEHVRRKGLFKTLAISYVPEEGGPEQLYLSLGFRPTGEMDEDEVGMALQLGAAAS